MARIKYYDASTETWKYADEFGTAGVTPYGIGAIPSPKVAEVGQTIVVKSVDENSKPTEWEAADLPSGGGEWELLTTVTLAEDVNDLVIKTCDDGTAFADKHIREMAVFGTIAANESLTTKTDLSFIPGGYHPMYLGGESKLTGALSPTAAQHIRVYVITMGEGLMFWHGTGNTMNQRWTDISQGSMNATQLNSFRLYSNSSEAPMPIGTVIRIWGR